MSLRKANYLLIAPALAVYFISFWFKVVRWSYIVRPVKAIPARKLFSINVIGYMVNNILPGRIGELARAYLVGIKEGVSKSAILGTVVVERIFDGLALILIILSFSLLLPLGDFLSNLLKISALLFLGFLLFFISMVTFPTLFRKVTGKLLFFVPPRLRAIAELTVSSFIKGLRILHSPGRLVVVLFYSLLLWCMEAVVGYIMGLAFGLKLSQIVYFLSTGAANLATILPTTQGGIGPYEFLAKQTLVIFGVDSSLAVAYAIVLHAVLIFPMVFLGFIFLWTERISLSQLMQPVFIRNIENQSDGKARSVSSQEGIDASIEDGSRED